MYKTHSFLDFDHAPSNDDNLFQHQVSYFVILKQPGCVSIQRKHLGLLCYLFVMWVPLVQGTGNHWQESCTQCKCV